MMTWAMDMARAASVPGLIGIHSSDFEAVSEYWGWTSTTLVRAGFSTPDINKFLKAIYIDCDAEGGLSNSVINELKKRYKREKGEIQ